MNRNDARSSGAGLRPTLLYRATCPKCRLLSAMTVVMSGGAIVRIPVDSPAALRLYESFSQPAGRLAVVNRDGFHTGHAIALAVVRAVLHAVTALVRRSATARTRGDGEADAAFPPR